MKAENLLIVAAMGLLGFVAFKVFYKASPEGRAVPTPAWVTKLNESQGVYESDANGGMSLAPASWLSSSYESTPRSISTAELNGWYVR